MENTENIKQFAHILRLTQLRNNLNSVIHQAQLDKPSYLKFLKKILESEIQHRQNADLERRLKMAKLPNFHNLDNYDYNFYNGLTQPRLEQLRELIWLEQNFNIILMGPSGTGKTFIASGLIYQAVKSGYKAYFRTMEEIVNMLKLKEMTTSSMNEYNRLIKANLIAIDDIMMFPIKKHEAVAFFNLINVLHEKCSVIITTNKSPKQWAETLEDEVLASALLDRLLYRCEIIKLEGNSYRLENRKTIFKNE